MSMFRSPESDNFKPRRDVVLWSGGVDSTMALIDAHELASEDRTYTPLALTIIQKQVTANAEQAACREKIKKWLERNNFSISYAEVSISEDGVGVAHTGGGNPQALLWLSVAINYVGERDNLVMGYVRGDDFWHHKEAYERAFQGLAEVGGRKGKILFPLEWKTKTDILKRYNWRPGLLKLCWSCQSPRNGKPCKECVSCVKHTDAARQVEKDRVKYKHIGKETKAKEPS